jgi:hypothetical protein
MVTMPTQVLLPPLPAKSKAVARAAEQGGAAHDADCVAQGAGGHGREY